MNGPKGFHDVCEQPGNSVIKAIKLYHEGIVGIYVNFCLKGIGIG